MRACGRNMKQPWRDREREGASKSVDAWGRGTPSTQSPRANGRQTIPRARFRHQCCTSFALLGLASVARRSNQRAWLLSQAFAFPWACQPDASTLTATSIFTQYLGFIDPVAVSGPVAAAWSRDSLVDAE
jgi:hypothetical protein